MSFYRRNLPHWQPEEAQFFITFRLAASLPTQVIEQLKTEQKELENSDLSPTQMQRRVFSKYEKHLDGTSIGPTWLENKKIAEIVCESIHYRDKEIYDLYAYCIMPNHVHLVFKLIRKKEQQPTRPVTKVLQKLKRYTALECNKILNRKGQFWQYESFDRVIRANNELEHNQVYIE